MIQVTEKAYDEIVDVYSSVRWTAVSKYCVQLIHLGVSLILARLLAPEYFGLLSMAFVVVGFVDVFKTLGLNSAIIQRAQISEVLLSSVYYAQLAVCFVFAGVVVALAPLVSWMYADSRVSSVVYVLSVNLLLAGFEMVPTALLTRRLAFRKIGLCEISAALVGGTSSIALALAGWGVWALVWGTLAGTFVRVLTINFVCDWRPVWRFEWAQVRTVMNFGLNLTGFNALNYVARNADNLIIGMFLGPTALGYYAIAYKLMLLPRNAISQIVCRVMFPAFSRFQYDDDRLAKGYLRCCGAIAFATFPAMFGLAVLARPFVEVVLGANWLPAVPLICILAPIGALQSVTTTVGQIYMAKGRTDWLLYWGLLGGGTLVASFAIGLPWGIVGVAGSYAIANALIAVPCFWIPFRLIPSLTLGLMARTLWPYLALSSLMAAFVLLVQTASYILGFTDPAVLTVSTASGLIAYAGLTLVFRPEAAADFASLLTRNRVEAVTEPLPADEGRSCFSNTASHPSAKSRLDVPLKQG